MAEGELPFHEHEQAAIKKIKAFISDQGLEQDVRLFVNVEIYDRTKHYYECDLILLGKDFLVIGELKNWYGDVLVTDNSWEREGKEVPNPHKSNNFKCKVLASLIKTKFPAVRLPFINSWVILTHPEGQIRFARGTFEEAKGQKQGNITFSTLQEFMRFFRKRCVETDARQALPLAQLGQVERFLETLSAQPKHFKTQIPGFTICESLTETSLWAEYLAFPEGSFDKNLKRLRVFGQLSSDPVTSAKQTRHFKALELMGPHRNILKTHAHPNAKQLLVEVADWADSTTLRHLLERRGRLELSLAKGLLSQLLEAVCHIHRSAVIHRNICPESILVTGQTLRLMNFDLAFVEQGMHTVIPSNEASAISPYRAPEVARGEHQNASDIYSWGIVAYEILTGSRPCASWEDLAATAGSLTEVQVQELIDTGIEDSWIEAVKKAVLVRHEERPSAEELSSTIIGKPAVPPVEEFGTTFNEELAPGTSYGIFEIEEKISQGATAQVYRALKGGKDGQVIALKVFNLEHPREMFRQECEIARRVSSPYIVEFLSFCQGKDERYCLELEFVDGPSIHALIRQSILPSEEEFTGVVRCLLEALIELHGNEQEGSSQLFVHNDINPTNVILSARGPKLIDLGVASAPGPGIYCGVPIYVAPDLVQGGQLNRSVSNDLFGLAVTLFEWLTGKHPFGGVQAVEAAELPAELPLAELRPWWKRCLAVRSSDRFSTAQEMLESFEHWLNPIPELEITVESSLEETFTPDEPVTNEPVHGETAVQSPLMPPFGTATQIPSKDARTEQTDVAHAFVDYLNSLHNTTALNKFALAEAQAISSHFQQVQVRHPVLDPILRVFQQEEPAVVFLTGHAGDGKSTIGMGVYKWTEGIGENEPLQSPLAPVQETIINGRPLFIVKDMSEASADERKRICERATADDANWLIITNTGPLLNTIGELVGHKEEDRLKAENKVLVALDESFESEFTPELQLSVFEKKVYTINLSRVDNLFLFPEFVNNVVNADYWNSCKKCPAYDDCPIRINASTLRDHQGVVDRFTWLYRCVTEYGSRIPARQMTAHIAYSITAGLSCRRVLKTLEEQTLATNDYLICNSFFGYKGAVKRAEAETLGAIRQISALNYGGEPFPRLERVLRTSSETVPLVSSDLARRFQIVLEKLATASDTLQNLIRQELRRFVYAYAALDESTEPFVDFFVGSPRLRLYERWLTSGFEPMEKEDLLNQRILPTLLEAFTGFAPVVARGRDSHPLLITLRRDEFDLLQFVQKVTGSVTFRDFDLRIDQTKRTLVLDYTGGGKGISLSLPLTVLDFMDKRAAGELCDELDADYKNRLKAFRSQLLNQCRTGQDRNGQFTLVQSAASGELLTVQGAFLRERIRVRYEN